MSMLIAPTALEDNGLWLVDFHDFAHDWLEQPIIGLIRHALL